MIAIKGKTMRLKITIEQFEEYLDNQVGFCVACGSERECCEPDACKYTCEDCGLPKVYGPEQLLCMGLVE